MHRQTVVRLEIIPSPPVPAGWLDGLENNQSGGKSMTLGHSLNLSATLLLLLGLAVFAGPASAQQSSEVEAVKAVNQAFYRALSDQSMKAMKSVWANKPYVVNIGPRSKKLIVGYENAVVNYWPRTFERFSEIDVKLTSIAHIQVNSKLASIVGTERAVLQPKGGGEPRRFDLFVTNLFEKVGDQWQMISHHAQRIPS